MQRQSLAEKISSHLLHVRRVREFIDPANVATLSELNYEQHGRRQPRGRDDGPGRSGRNKSLASRVEKSPQIDRAIPSDTAERKLAGSRTFCQESVFQRTGAREFPPSTGLTLATVTGGKRATGSARTVRTSPGTAGGLLR
jgi:hypothetical protein